MWEPLETGAPGGWQKSLSRASEAELLLLSQEWLTRVQALDPRSAPRLHTEAARSTLSHAQGLLSAGRAREARQALIGLCRGSSVDMGAFEFYALFGPARELGAALPSAPGSAP